METNQATYKLNNDLLVCYSSHDLNNGPFNYRTGLDHSNTKLVRYPDPHCIFIKKCACIMRVNI